MEICIFKFISHRGFYWVKYEWFDCNTDWKDVSSESLTCCRNADYPECHMNSLFFFFSSLLKFKGISSSLPTLTAGSATGGKRWRRNWKPCTSKRCVRRWGGEMLGVYKDRAESVWNIILVFYAFKLTSDWLLKVWTAGGWNLRDHEKAISKASYKFKIKLTVFRVVWGFGSLNIKLSIIIIIFCFYIDGMLESS